jgi:hypothetical protein
MIIVFTINLKFNLNLNLPIFGRSYISAREFSKRMIVLTPSIIALNKLKLSGIIKIGGERVQLYLNKTCYIQHEKKKPIIYIRLTAVKS